MKKYLQIFSIGMKEMLTYRFDVFGKGISCFFKICIAYFMWNIIYAMNSKVGGYTFNQMITYYLLINFLLSFEKSTEVSKLLAEEIKTGNFTKYIVKPLGPFGYYLTLNLSKMIFSFIINVISMGIWLIVFHSFFVLNMNLTVVLNSILVFFLGMFFIALLNYFFTILTFWVIDSSAFFMIKDHIVEFVTGALIPLSLLPKDVICVFKYTPFYYIYYYPVNMCVNGDLTGVGLAFAVLTVSCAILLIIVLVFYKYAVRVYEGVGI